MSYLLLIFYTLCSLDCMLLKSLLVQEMTVIGVPQNSMKLSKKT